MRQPNRRICLRLPAPLLSAVDARAVAIGYDLTRTAIIKESLSLLVHDLQTEHLSSETFEQLLSRYGARCDRQQITLRLPVVILDYLKLNQINLTSAIEVALITYCKWLSRE